MSEDDNSSNVKDVIDATTGLVKAVPIYEDLVQPAAKEIGTALGTIAKTVNLALAPISGVIWSYETIKDFVATTVSEKLKHIPPENIITPNPIVAGPALEALKYTGHEDVLREMYANLLASALNKSTANTVHPAFVELIKQLSPAEASLLLFLSERTEYPQVCNYYDEISIAGGWGLFGDSVTSNQVRKVFINICEKFNKNLDISAALDNYLRLQILDIESDTKQTIRDSWIEHDTDQLCKKLGLEIEHTEKLYFTSFGETFLDTCVKCKT